MTKKEEYFVNTLREKELSEEEVIYLDKEVKDSLVDLAREKGMELNDLINYILMKRVVEFYKEKYKDEYENIIDIYDLYDIENLIETKKIYLVLNPSGKHVMLIPYEGNEELVDMLEDKKNGKE